MIVPRLARPLGAAVAAVSLAMAVGAIYTATRFSAPPTTYAATSWVLATADAAAGLALIIAASLVWFAGPLRPLTAVAVVAGWSWFAPDWIGWTGGPALVRSVAFLAEPLLAASLFNLVVLSITRSGNTARRGVAAGYAVALMLGLGRALFFDPFDDPACWRFCGGNAFLIASNDGLARLFVAAILTGTVVLGLAGVALAARALLRASDRGGVSMRAAAALAVGLALAASATLRLLRPHETPSDPPFADAYLALAAAVTFLAASTAWPIVSTRLRIGAIERLADALGSAPAPGSLRLVLARAIGDPDLDVGYWVAEAGSYVDEDGLPLQFEQFHGDRVTTPVERGGAPVAVVIHKPSDMAAADIAREIGAAARLAVDNERLAAALRARAQELRASRTRIIETADRERRRLERNLHDGAQQRLIAVTYEIRLATAEARRADNAAAANVLEAAVTEALAALDELRVLAHGIYPTILGESGLGPALGSLAATAPLPMELELGAMGRCPPVTEAAAYHFVVESLSQAVRGGASFVQLSVRPTGDGVIVRVTSDCPGQPDPFFRLADRIGAAGGTLAVADPGPAGALPAGFVIEATLPCA